ncbi:hypothetical protein GGS21DRAFT_409421 [Xylaria nigripes]|nr:hypothetical protein GGS21DRAFT_409421 [Xylaria nigripes]
MNREHYLSYSISSYLIGCDCCQPCLAESFQQLVMTHRGHGAFIACDAIIRLSTGTIEYLIQDRRGRALPSLVESRYHRRCDTDELVASHAQDADLLTLLEIVATVLHARNPSRTEINYISECHERTRFHNKPTMGFTVLHISRRLISRNRTAKGPNDCRASGNSVDRCSSRSMDWPVRSMCGIPIGPFIRSFVTRERRAHSKLCTRDFIHVSAQQNPHQNPKSRTSWCEFDRHHFAKKVPIASGDEASQLVDRLSQNVKEVLSDRPSAGRSTCTSARRRNHQASSQSPM